MKRLGMMFVFVAMVVAVSSGAYALPTLSIFDPAVMGAPILITDGGVGDVDGVVNGIVSYNEAVSGFLGGFGSAFSTLTATTGTTLAGTPGFANLDLSSLNLSSVAGGTLTIGFSVDGLTGLPPVVQGWAAGIGGMTDGTVNYSAFLDAGNALFATTTALGSTGPLGSGVFGANFTSALVPAAAPYSLTQFVKIVHGAGAISSTSFNAELSAVPEPGTVLLLGFGLVGLGLYDRRRKTRSSC